MPHDWEDLYEDVLDTHGEPVTYTPPTGDPVSVTEAGWIPTPPELEEATDGLARVRTARCVIKIGEVAAPARGGKVTRDSEEWAIERVLKRGTAAHELYLKRTESIEKSREGHRMRR